MQRHPECVEPEGALEAIGRLASAVFPPDIPSSKLYMEELRRETWADLHWAASLDPAMQTEIEVNKVCRGASAIAFHRLAHIVWRKLGNRETALAIANQSALLTGIEIHPAARIGPMFSIDHGFGTVIGETTEIGEQCIVLNNVTLGARAVGPRAKAKTGMKRHPSIGNRVRICGNVGIYGPVKVGDDCWIGPGVHIDRDLSPNSRVQLVSEYMVILPSGDGNPRFPRIVMVSPKSAEKGTHEIDVRIEGECLSQGAQVMLKKDKLAITGSIVFHGEDTLICSFPVGEAGVGMWDVQVVNEDGQYCILANAITVL